MKEEIIRVLASNMSDAQQIQIKDKLLSDFLERTDGHTQEVLTVLIGKELIEGLVNAVLETIDETDTIPRITIIFYANAINIFINDMYTTRYLIESLIKEELKRNIRIV